MYHRLMVAITRKTGYKKTKKKHKRSESAVPLFNAAATERSKLPTVVIRILLFIAIIISHNLIESFTYSRLVY